MTATKWVKETNAIWIKPSRGKYSEDTFAHRDIALEFAKKLDAALISSSTFFVETRKVLKKDETKLLK